MLGRGEPEFYSCTTHLILQSIFSPFEHCMFCSVVEYWQLELPVGGVLRNYMREYSAIYASSVRELYTY